LTLTTLLGLLAWLPLRRSVAAAREPERHATSAATLIMRGASSGFGSLWAVLLAPALLLALAERVDGAASGTLLLTTFVAGALALGPLSLALGGLGTLATPSRSVAALARLELEPTRRHGGFDEAVALGDRAGAAQGAIALGLGLWLGLLAFPSASGATASSNVGLAALATALGVTCVVVFGARAARGAIAAARLVGAEVERQLPEARHGAPIPTDFSPSYKGCLDALTDSARSLPWLEVAALLLSPFALAALLRQTGSALTPTLLAFGLATLVTGVVVSLGGRATRAVLAEQRKRARAATDAGAAALADADAFGALLGVTATANIEALVLSLALTVICLAPLLR
jgi:hypothetical protein